jgi:hypothetical protein
MALVLSSAAAITVVASGPANAQFNSCTYDSTSHTVTATLTSATRGRLVVGPGGAIQSGDDAGTTATSCGTATVTNTNTINVTGYSDAEQVIIDLRGGAFAPGFTAESGSSSEIEFNINLGSVPSSWAAAATERLVIVGGNGADHVSVVCATAVTCGNRRVNLNADETTGVDFDVTLAGTGFGSPGVEFDLGDGNDTIDTDPPGSVQAAFPLTEIGGAGADLLEGGAGPDTIIGGAGADTIHAGPGDDQVNADDGTADSVDCGPGVDVASLDSSDSSTGCEVGPVPDTTAPDTAILKKPKKTVTHARVTIAFTSNEPGSSFQCKANGDRVKKKLRKFAACSSPVVYKHLLPGRYAVQVRAIDAAGNVDASPARVRFTRVLPQHHHHHHHHG